MRGAPDDPSLTPRGAFPIPYQLRMRRLHAILIATLVAAAATPARAVGLEIRQALFEALAARQHGEPGRMVDVIVRLRTAHPDGAALSPDPLREPLHERRAAVAARATALMTALAPDPAPLAMPLAPRLGAAAEIVDDLWVARSVHVRVPADRLAELLAHPDVDGVFEDVLVQAITPTALGDHVVTRPGGFESWGHLRIRTLQARQQFRVDGAGVVVGHIDTGVDAAHPAFRGAVVRFRDFVNGRWSAYDDDGHGTHTAGTIVGRGGVGVAPGARLVVAKALDRNGRGSLSNLLKAMQWMLDPDGDPRTNDRPQLVSNSWGVERGEAHFAGFEDTLFWETVRAWRAAGIVPVFSAGNSGRGDVLVPGAYPVNLAVGATDGSDGVADFSSSGRCDWHGWAFYKPDLSAPGVNIPSAYPGGRTAWISGTSMAAPHVAGTLALSIQLKPSIPMRERERLLLDASVDIGSPGRGQRSGEGRLNVLKTLELTKGWKPGAPVEGYAPVYMRARRHRTR